MRKLMAILRLFYFAVIGVLLLFCLLFALMQTKWAKETVAAYIAKAYQQNGIHVKIEHLKGSLPFTWHIDRLFLEWGVAESLELCNVKVRIAILPLLNKTVSINYFNVEQGHLAFSRASYSHPFNFKQFKLKVEKKIEALCLPFRFILHRLKIDSLSCENLSEKKTAVYFVVAEGDLHKQMRQFQAKLTLIPRGYPDNVLLLQTMGSQKRNEISFDMKAHLNCMQSFSIFYPIPFENAIELSFSLQGPWSQWNALWNEEALSSPLLGHCQLELQPLNTDSSSDFGINRPWSVDAQFSVPTYHSLFFNPFILKSDLINAVVQGEMDKDLEKSSGRLSFTLPELSLFDEGMAKLHPRFFRWMRFFAIPSDSKILKGSVEGEATYTRGHLIAEIEGRHVHTYTLPLEDLSGHIEADYFENSWGGNAHFETQAGPFPLTSAFDLVWQPGDEFSLYDLHVKGPSLMISGDLSVDLNSNLFKGGLYAHIEQLNQLTSFLLNERTVDGNVAIECEFSGEQDKQNVSCSLLGEHCFFDDITIEQLGLFTTINDLFQKPLGSFNLFGKNAHISNFEIAHFDIQTSSGEEEERWPFSLQCKGESEGPFLLAAEGVCKKDETLFELEINAFSGQLFSYPFSLNYPCTFDLGEHFCSLSPVNMTIDAGNLFAQFSLSEVRSTLQCDVEHIPLKLLNFLHLNREFSGTFSCKGFIDAIPNDIQGTLTAQLEEVRFLHFDKKEPLKVKGSLQAHLDHHVLQMHSYIRATGEQYFDFSATVPLVYTLYPLTLCIDKERSLASELIAQGKVEDLFDFFNLGAQQVTGCLSSRLFLSQTFNNPSLQGNIEWREGTYENYLTGTSLQNIQAELFAANHQIHLSSFSAHDNKKGTVTAEGSITLDPHAHFPYAFIAELNHLNTVNFNPIDCNLTGPLYIHGTTQNAFAQGNLIVPHAEFKIPETLALQIPVLPVTFINTPYSLAPSTLTPPRAFPFNINLELTAENNVHVTGKGLNSVWGGSLLLTGTNMNILASGTLQLIKGEYSLFGKTFKLIEGQIIFNDKPSPSATINLSGTLSLAETTITAYLRGPLSSPVLTFQSNPQMSTSAILARMLFNKDISDISQPEAIQLATTLISLSGGAGPSVLETIRKNLGVDRLTIASQTTNPDEIAVQIGKYLTKGVMITLSQSATSSQIIVEVEFKHGFVFQAETQEEQEGKFSLKWTHSY